MRARWFLWPAAGVGGIDVQGVWGSLKSQISETPHRLVANQGALILDDSGHCMGLYLVEPGREPCDRFVGRIDLCAEFLEKEIQPALQDLAKDLGQGP